LRMFCIKILQKPDCLISRIRPLALPLQKGIMDL
jgi:hypothetical protein